MRQRLMVLLLVAVFTVLSIAGGVPNSIDAEMTEPEVTDPVVTDPEVTDPAGSDPAVTDPEVPAEEYYYPTVGIEIDGIVVNVPAGGAIGAKDNLPAEFHNVGFRLGTVEGYFSGVTRGGEGTPLVMNLGVDYAPGGSGILGGDYDFEVLNVPAGYNYVVRVGETFATDTITVGSGLGNITILFTKMEPVETDPVETDPVEEYFKPMVRISIDGTVVMVPEGGPNGAKDNLPAEFQNVGFRLGTVEGNFSGKTRGAANYPLVLNLGMDYAPGGNGILGGDYDFEVLNAPAGYSYEVRVGDTFATDMITVGPNSATISIEFTKLPKYYYPTVGIRIDGTVINVPSGGPNGSTENLPEEFKNVGFRLGTVEGNFSEKTRGAADYALVLNLGLDYAPGGIGIAEGDYDFEVLNAPAGYSYEIRIFDKVVTDTITVAPGLGNITIVFTKLDPVETDPSEPDPTVTDPSETDPTVTDPSETDPSETDPSETDPTVTDPSETDPSETDPTVTEPTVTEPTVTEPTIAEPTVTEPTATEPTVTDPSETDPSVTDSTNPAVEVVIEYVPNGGIFADGSRANKYVDAKVGDEIVIIDAPVREGFEFQYWQGSMYYPGDKFIVPADGHQFIAMWKPVGTAATTTATPTPTTTAAQTIAKTGENASMYPWIGLLFISAAGVLVLTKPRKENN